ncbi:hypothetical protein KM043_006339 [Ampulex compressa]|nr:hypothetical protein KM043_006339 [Ampulex compressa]
MRFENAKKIRTEVQRAREQDPDRACSHNEKRSPTRTFSLLDDSKTRVAEISASSSPRGASKRPVSEPSAGRVASQRRMYNRERVFFLTRRPRQPLRESCK